MLTAVPINPEIGIEVEDVNPWLAGLDPIPTYDPGPYGELIPGGINPIIELGSKAGGIVS